MWCRHCGKVHFQEPLVVQARRQVFDIPAPRIEVTEHRVLAWVCCGCHYENRGECLPGVTSATQYGPRLQTMSVLFNNAYSIPRNKVQQNWEHVASNEWYTCLFVHQKRGVIAHEDDLSILPGFKNWAAHDCWTSYFLFNLCRHAACGPHLLRELTALIEQGRKWARKLHAFLLDLYQRSQKGRMNIPEEQHPQIIFKYKELLR